MDTRSKSPRVSIGLPVFNGERFVGNAIRSLLCQTYADFEIVISDNCSTDSTENICRGFEHADPRVRYYRQEKNVGPLRNFNGLVPMCTGEYFKWAAHDDTYDPSYLARCVEVLDGDPTVVLCHSATRIIDAGGAPVSDYVSSLRTDSPSRHIRFHDLLQNYTCYEIFGVMRRDILTQTPLFGSFGHADGVLLARLGLFGRIVQLPDFLFFNRHHPGKSLNQYKNYRDYTVWLDPATAGKILLPRWRMGWEFTKAACQVPMEPGERLMCIAQMVSWVGRFWMSLASNLLHAIGQILGVTKHG